MTSPVVLMKAWNVRPKKDLGQNFIRDTATAEMIVARSKVAPHDIVVEIGAGLGALTLALAPCVQKVYAVEKDRQIAKLLRNELLAAGCENVNLRIQDVLGLDFPAIAASAGKRLIVMGNIPYNISSQILVQLIAERGCIKKAALMFQKELAQRITSPPGGKSYGRLAVMLGYCATVNPIATVKPAAFYPRPQVDSLVLEIVFQDSPKPKAEDEAFLFKVVKAAFSKRRKTLKNALAGSILEMDAKTAGQELANAGIDPVRRAETLTVPEFVGLSNRLYQAGYR